VRNRTKVMLDKDLQIQRTTRRILLPPYCRRRLPGRQSMSEERTWRDPRDGRVWLVRTFVGSVHGPTGQEGEHPRMLTFRHPANPGESLIEIHSVLFDPPQRVVELS